MQCPQCKIPFKTKFIPKFNQEISGTLYECVYCPKCRKVIIVKKAEVSK